MTVPLLIEALEDMHLQSIELIDLFNEFAKKPFNTHTDEFGYDYVKTDEDKVTELKSAQEKFLRAFEVHRMLLDKFYRIDKLSEYNMITGEITDDHNEAE